MVMRRGEWWSAYGAVPMRVDLCTMRMEEIYPEVTTLHRRTRHWVQTHIMIVTWPLQWFITTLSHASLSELSES
eukprot:COSAG04_NODE_413_length_14740_cov_85.508572_10_plen_74_part_00